jgi:hypothetical protein
MTSSTKVVLSTAVDCGQVENNRTIPPKTPLRRVGPAITEAGSGPASGFGVKFSRARGRAMYSRERHAALP